MKMIVAAVGTVLQPVRVDHDRRVATFTLQVEEDRYLVTTVGLVQFRRITEDPEPNRLLVLGNTFSFPNKICGRHHVGINPLVIEPLDGLSDEELIRLQHIAGQWFVTSLLSVAGNGRGRKT